MRTVDIILRTHSGPNVHGGTRVFKGTKEELILGCFRSLLRTLKMVDRERYALRLSILDDHSSESCVEALQTLMRGLQFETRFIPLHDRGVGASFGAAYKYARDIAEDIIYFVEDDYLHAPTALPEMLEAQELFSQNLGGQEVGIFPVDYPSNYDPRWMQPSYLVMGPHRHWHTDFSTTGTFLLTKTAFMKHFHHCMRMSLYKIDPEVSEQSSVNYMWREDVKLFSPVPTLALHMQDETIISPYIDWKKWWDEYAY